MPTGTGAVNLRNLPATQYRVDPGLFNQLTSRVIFDPIAFPLPSPGGYVQNQLLQVGVVSRLRLRVQGTIAWSSANIDGVSAKYPWDMISIQVSGNGQNNFISCTGSDLRLRQLAANRAWTDDLSVVPAAATLAGGASGSAPFDLYYEVPIAMDPTTLIGALYAQSEATNLTYRVQTANLSDLFDLTGSPAITITATVTLEEELFEVPYDPQHPDVLVIPDLTVLHGLVANDNAIASNTTVDTNLFRINGQMERLFFYAVDTSGAKPVFVPNATYDYAQLIYGSNQTPYTFDPIQMLHARNTQDYRKGLPSALVRATADAIASGVYCLDFVADNSARDQVLLEGVTNLRLRSAFTVAPTGGSYVHFVQETLFA
jgi:hypothetical protein